MIKPLSRQRRWQLRQRALGNCTTCGRPAFTAQHCLKHARAARERVRARVGSKRRYNSKTYNRQ
jgi:hypothetical protein